MFQKGFRVDEKKLVDNGYLMDAGNWVRPYFNETVDVIFDSIQDTYTYLKIDGGFSSIVTIDENGCLNNNNKKVFIKKKWLHNSFVITKYDDILSGKVLFPTETFIRKSLEDVEYGDWVVMGGSAYKINDIGKEYIGILDTIDGYKEHSKIPVDMLEETNFFSPRFTVSYGKYGTFIDRNLNIWENSPKDGCKLKSLRNKPRIPWYGYKYPEFFAPFTKIEV